MSRLGTLVVELAAEIRKYIADMNTAAATTEATTARIDSAVDKVQSKVVQANQATAQSFKATASQLEGDAGRMIAKLQKQHETFGMSAEQIRRWEVANVQATGSQRALLESLLTAVEAQEAQVAATAASSMGMTVFAAAGAAVVATLGAVAYGWWAGANESKDFAKTLLTSGNQAGVTAGRLMEMAQAVGQVTQNQGTAAAVLNQLAATGDVAASMLQEAAQAAIGFERAGVQAAQETVKQFARLGEEPLEAAMDLHKQYGLLTVSTYEQIKALEEQGRTTEAGALAQKVFADTLKERTPELEKNLGIIERGWRSVKDVVLGAVDALKNIGRDVGAEGQAAALNGSIKALEEQIRRRGGTDSNVSNMLYSGQTLYDQETEALKQQLAVLKERQSVFQSDARMMKAAAEAQADQVRQVEARAKWDKDGLQYLDKKAKMEREIAQALSEGRAAGVAQAVIEERLASIRDKYTEKVRNGKQAVDEFGQALERVQGKEAGLNADYDKTLAALYQGYVQGRIGAEDYAKAVEALIKQQPFYRAGLEAQAKAEKATATAAVEAAKARNAAFDEYFDRIEDERVRNEGRIKAARTMLEQIEFETSLLGMNAEQRAVATAMRELERQGVVKGTQAWEAYAEAIRKAVENREAQTQAIGFWTSIENTAHNVWTSVTEEGQSAFERIGKTLKAAVLDLLWQMTARRWLIQLGVSLGVPGAAQAAAQAGSAADWFSGFSSIASSLGALSSGLQAGFGALLNGGLFEAVSTGVTAAFTGGTLGSVFAGIGTALGALGPIAAIVGLIASLDDSGTMHTGGLGSYSEAGGSATGDAVKAQAPGFFNLNRDHYQTSTANASANLARSLVGLLDSTARTFGRTAGYYVATAFADDTSADGAWGSLLIKIGDRIIADWGPGGDNVLGREFADGEEGAREYALAVAKDMRDYLVTQTPDWADEMLNALGEAPTLEDLAATVEVINAAARVFETFGSVAANFGSIGEEAMSALVEAMGGAQAAAQQLSAYYQDFYTDAERRAVVQRQVEAQLTELGVKNLPKTRAEFRALVESLDLSTEAGRKMYAALMALAPAFASYTEEMVDAAAQAAQRVASIASEIAAAVEKAQQEARQAAQEQLATARANLQAAVAREKAIIQERLANWQTLAQETQAVFDTLENGIRSLQDAALGPELSGQQGQAFIAQALAAARATGSLPDAEELSAAIAAAQQGMTAEIYGSEAERRYAQLKLAGELKALQDISGDQLSEAERQIELEEDQLKALDDLLAYWNGYGQKGIDATMSVGDAVKAMEVAVNATLEEGFGSISGLGGKTLLEQLTRVAQQHSAGTTAASLQELTESIMAGTIDLNTAVNLLAGTPTTSKLYHEQVEVYKSFTPEEYYAEIRRNIDTLINGGMSGQALAESMISWGVSLTDAARAYGVTAADIAANLLAAGATTLPQLAVGTNFVPRDMLALIHQGEAVVPKAFNPWAGGRWSAPSMATDTRSLERWLGALDSRFARIEWQLAVVGTAAEETASVLRRVTAGPALRMEAA